MLGDPGDSLMVRLTSDPLDVGEAFDFAAHPGAGAVVLFAGTVRDHSDAGEVSALDYEVWEEEAFSRLEEIGEELLDRWPVRRAAILHRHGHLEVGEVSVVVCCSAPHRAEAFEAARHGIERVKREVPIWKKERVVGGEARWVMGS